jgi:hypothetical protein
LKRTWVPLLESRGFSVDMSDAPLFVRFRRTAGGLVHLLEVQWDKYGRRRFAINVGKCPVAGLRVRGELFPVEKVSVGWLEELGRLRPGRGRSTWRAVVMGADWFSQDTPLLQRWFGREKLRAPDDVVRGLVSLLPELEAYLVSGAVGEHLTIMRIPRQE